MTTGDGHHPEYENGHEPEAQAEVAEGLEQRRRHIPTPSLQDMLGIGFGGGGFVLGKEMLTGSDDPKEYLARTEFSLRDIDVMKNVLYRMMRAKMGKVDFLGIMAFEANARISLNRQGRDEAVKIATQSPYYSGRHRPGFFGGASDVSERARDFQGGAGRGQGRP